MKVKVVQVYGAFYLAPSPKGFNTEEEAMKALPAPEAWGSVEEAARAIYARWDEQANSGDPFTTGEMADIAARTLLARGVPRNYEAARQQAHKMGWIMPKTVSDAIVDAAFASPEPSDRGKTFPVERRVAPTLPSHFVGTVSYYTRVERTPQADTFGRVISSPDQRSTPHVYPAPEACPTCHGWGCVGADHIGGFTRTKPCPDPFHTEPTVPTRGGGAASPNSEAVGTPTNAGSASDKARCRGGENNELTPGHRAGAAPTPPESGERARFNEWLAGSMSYQATTNRWLHAAMFDAWKARAAGGEEVVVAGWWRTCGGVAFVEVGDLPEVGDPNAKSFGVPRENWGNWPDATRIEIALRKAR